ncbi:vanadium-dependent haloperoxidase [Ensifer aridi]|uniref:vanadium-dependent haloperoxidase n=1 Tax=Ensifer aridi TaxID=1708715 RepID=UPI000A113BE0|nr:vanadium-dependent haloperoxidase [Ensifer aridi]
MNGTTLDPAIVRGWSDVTLELNAVDHSLPPDKAKAPGPCASTYAIALAHAAIADACAHALGTFRPALMLNGPRTAPTQIDRFVGGAAYGFLSSLFTEPEHVATLDNARIRFPNGGADWQSGIDLTQQLVAIWAQGKVRERVNPAQPFYQELLGQHRPDPLNRDQGYYGQAWAGQTASVQNVPAELQAPIAPLGVHIRELQSIWNTLRPPNSATFEASARDVSARGALPPDVGRNGPQADQLTVGTFWAYDGAAGLGTPPRLYLQLVSQVIDAQRDPLDAAEWARLLALCSIAMADASIVAWQGKYEHAIARPIVWLRTLAPAEFRDPSWTPLGSPRSRRPNPGAAAITNVDAQAVIGRTIDQQKFTPNFPAYPSGHAAFGGACFAVLEVWLRRDRLQSDGSPIALSSEELDALTIDPFTTRPRPTIGVDFVTTGKLREANLQSRVWIGVHWDFDGFDGDRAGAEVGRRVAATLYRS